MMSGAVECSQGPLPFPPPLDHFVKSRTTETKMPIRRNIDITLTDEEELVIVRKWAKKCPDAVRSIMDHPKGHCPFPDSCSSFPCKRLDCNADVCDNGRAYRMS